LQRLFSTFANGWPGAGLLLLRLLTGAALIYYGIAEPLEAHRLASVAPQIIGACAGILLLAGLWTPVVGTLVTIVEVWIAFSRAGRPWIFIMLAALGAALAMIGPGAWSLDARLFGRKHIETPKR
jgi:putative oxidoreductase